MTAEQLWETLLTPKQIERFKELLRERDERDTR